VTRVVNKDWRLDDERSLTFQEADALEKKIQQDSDCAGDHKSVGLLPSDQHALFREYIFDEAVEKIAKHGE
jgi:hypothetical protein